MYSVSVAMAAYNGQAYIKEQIESILKQLKENDELIISLDKSSDQSEKIIRSFNDARIQLIPGPNQGVVSNFENAIKHTSNDIIFLSDQDDIWLDNKVERVLSSFDEHTQVVLHDCKVVDQDLNEIESSFFQLRNSQLGIRKNLIKNSYMGACMAFRKELKEYILPFPKDIPMHDQWIGLMGETIGNNKLLNEVLLLYRRHGNNETQLNHSSVVNMVRWRIQMIRALRRRKRGVV